MNVKELIEQLSKLPPETIVSIHGARGYGYDYDSSNLTFEEGYFVGDEHQVGEGIFVEKVTATIPCGDGKPLLDLTSPLIKPGIKFRFNRYPGRPVSTTIPLATTAAGRAFDAEQDARRTWQRK